MVCGLPRRTMLGRVAPFKGSGVGAGVDSAWKQYKLEARKILVNGDESHLPKRSEGVRAVLGVLTGGKTR